MPLSLAGESTLHPLHVADHCAKRGFPTSPWLGTANSFTNPLGGAPGRGTLLMLRDSLDKMDLQEGDKFRPLQIDDGFTKITIANVLIVAPPKCVLPGAEDDPRSAYMVEIADRRWLEWDRGETLSAAYNVRSHLTGEYYSGTLNSGVAYTWAQIFTAIWPSGLGTAPSLPFTPHGTPENWWWHGISKLKAVHHFLTRLACALKYDPVANVFTIVRLGLTTHTTATDADKLIAKYDERRVYEPYRKESRLAYYPGAIRVEFFVKRTYSDGSPPYYSLDNTVTPTAAAVAEDTILILEDDLSAHSSDGSTIDNASTLGDRATERYNDWVRVKTYFDRNEHYVYSGVLPLYKAVGAKWHACAWYDRGDGMKTELRTAPLETWKRCPPTYDGATPFDECCPGYFGDTSGCCDFFGAPPSDCGCGEPDPPLPPYEPIPSPSCVRCLGEYWAWFDQFGVFMYWTQIPCTQEPPLEWPRCDSLPPQVPGIPGGGDPGGGGPTRPDDGRRCHWEQNGQGQWEYRCFDFPGRSTDYGPHGDQPFGGPAFGASGRVDATVYAATGVTAGTYTNATITVGEDGKLTSASSGTAAAVTQKTSDQSRASTTTLANDSTLTFSMAANTTYRIRLNVGWACGVGGFKYALTGPSSPTSVRIWRRHWNPSSLTPTEALDTSYTSSTSDSSSGGGMLNMDIIVQNGANSGTFALQWAQASSDASNTTVQAGSSMEVLTF